MRLNDVIEALEMTSDTSKAFYDLVTKKIFQAFLLTKYKDIWWIIRHLPHLFTPRNRVAGDEPARGFESHALRHVVASCISLATTFLCFAAKVIVRLSFSCPVDAYQVTANPQHPLAE